MKSFDADGVFEPILADIKNGNIKTVHSLRVILENLSEQFNVKALLILAMFREWLARRGIELLTENGVVEIRGEGEK